MSLERRLLRLEQRFGSPATGPYEPESKPPFDYEGFHRVFAEVWAANVGEGGRGHDDDDS